MRTSLKLLTSCFSLLLLFGCGASNKVVEASAKSRAVDEMVANEQFVFDTEWVRPMATRAINSVMQSGLMPPGSSAAQINITGSGYFFKMEGDSVSASLPYFGERQMGGGYDADSGIEFNGVPKDLKIEKEETKLKYTITFNISKQTETYRCRLELFPNQTGTLLINSSHRFTIRYEGKVSTLESSQML